VINNSFKPAYLGLILGLVFLEEVSLSWIFTARLVRGVPSMSAYTLNSLVGADWLRKILVFSLAMGGATTGRTQSVLTLFGISLTCMVLLANLGARAWGFLQWKPIAIGGKLSFMEPLVAYLAAIVTGMLVPYMGHRGIQVGGEAAMESVMKSAILVAIIFVVSDYDEIQKFLVVGSEVRCFLINR